MDTETFVGLDASRSSIMATAVDPLGHTVVQRKLSTRDQELVRFLNELPGKKHVVLEACNVWEHVYDAASSTGAHVLLAHPLKTRIISEASLKTDRVDSEALALLGRLDAVPQAYAPPPEVRELRHLMRDRTFFAKLWSQTVNHTYAVLLQKGVPYEPGVLVKKSRREKFRALHLAEVDRALDALLRLEEITKPMDLEVERAFQNSREGQLLSTIPGVGPITAMTLVAYLCPIDRFHSLEAVVRYCGLCPSVRQSAETSHKGHLVWDAQRILKWILVEGQWNARRYERRGDVARVGKRVSRRSNEKDGAIAAARTLARICAAVLRRGTAYQPHAPGSASRLRSSA